MISRPDLTNTTHHQRSRRDRGFTLVELLIVIVILGILATVTVFAVRGITDQGEDNAAAVDLRTLETAAELYYAEQGVNPPDMDAMVTAGYLKQASTIHTYTDNGDGTYTITNVNGGGGGGGVPAPSATAGTAVTVGGVPMLSYGSGTNPFYIVGGAVAGGQWDTAVNATAPIGNPGFYTFYFVDIANVTDIAGAQQVRAAVEPNWGLQMSEADDVANFDGTANSLYDAIENGTANWVRFNPGAAADVAEIFATA